jgi:hypothetical protein
MADYRLTTRFEILAPITDVWSVLTRPEVWIEGWGDVLDSATIAAHPSSAPVGVRHSFRLRAHQLATLRFHTRIVRADAPYLIEWEVTGDVEGTASWELDDLDEITIGRNVWSVRTRSAWLNALAPAARRVYRHRQDDLMRNGLEALATHLGADLLAVHTSSHRPERHRLAGLALRVGPGASRADRRVGS